jgi:hypothetical protein
MTSEVGTPDTPRTVAAVIKRAEEAKHTLDQRLEQLSEEQLTTLRSQDGWTVRDHVLHLALWMNNLTAMLRHQPRWEVMDVGDASGQFHSIDEINDIFQQRYRTSSLTDVLMMYNNAHREVLNELSAMDDADLQKPYAAYQPQEQRDDSGLPILNWIAGDTYEHFEEHLGWIDQILAQKK